METAKQTTKPVNFVKRADKHQLSKIKAILQESRDRQANDPRIAHVNGYMAEILRGVSHGIIQQVPSEVLMNNPSHKELSGWYREMYGFDPLVIRIAKTVLVFDHKNMSPIVKRLYNYVQDETIIPEPLEVVRFLAEYPNDATETHSIGIKPFWIWIDNKPFMFNQNPFLALETVGDYLRSMLVITTLNDWL